MQTTRWIIYALHDGVPSPVSTTCETKDEAIRQARFWISSIKGLPIYVAPIVVDAAQGEQVLPEFKLQ